MIKSLFRRLFKDSVEPVQESIESRAERGDVEAQFILGVKFSQGHGSAPDYAQAARWYLQAAEQSHALAQFNLGVMYAQGQGRPSDKAESMLWFDRAAHLGDPGAQYQIGVMHHCASLEHHSVNASESRIEAYKWLQLSDDQGYGASVVARGLVTLQMTDAEVADGKRRVAGFVPRVSTAVPKTDL